MCQLARSLKARRYDKDKECPHFQSTYFTDCLSALPTHPNLSYGREMIVFASRNSSVGIFLKRQMPSTQTHLKVMLFLLAQLTVFFVLVQGCAHRKATLPRPGEEPAGKELERMGYCIQVGAFLHVGNAAQLATSLKRQGIDTYYFRDEKGLYKVRFGNFPTRRLALSRAQSLKNQGLIDDFYIVSPEDYPLARARQYGSSFLREEAVRTAKSFLGVPYMWGGTSAPEGFDCSGLTMAVYRLIGLDMPRSSQEQFKAGIPVEKKRLRKGDLVFFTTASPPKVSHVGLYIGDGAFVHAPGQGKTISIEHLSTPYYEQRYAGARSYIPSELK